MRDGSLIGMDELVAQVPDGAMLAIPKDESGVAMEAIRGLIRKGVEGLHLLCVPVCGLHADLLIGAGCVATVECGGIVINEIGAGPRFRVAVRDGTIQLKDSTCPAIHAGLQAGEKGQPFAALRGIIGSDLLKYRDDWHIVDNPFSGGKDPVVLVPALNPDVFLFHAAWGDRHGNVWIAGRRDLAEDFPRSRRYSGKHMQTIGLAVGSSRWRTRPVAPGRFRSPTGIARTSITTRNMRGSPEAMTGSGNTCPPMS